MTTDATAAPFRDDALVLGVDVGTSGVRVAVLDA